MSMPNSWDSLGFEQHIQALFRSNGYEVIDNDRQNEPGFDFIMKKNGTSIPVQVKAWKKKVPANTVGRFLEFCEESKFEKGIIVSLNGFTDSSHALALSDGKKKLFLGEYDHQKNTIKFNTDSNVTLPKAPQPKEPVKIAIFTAKGGVGKTTVSAHLAGALALGGKNVALLDIDPECNLHLLTSADSLKIPNQKTGNTYELQVFKEKDWLNNVKQQYDIVVADCSPAFVLNPEKIMREAEIFICPVVLSPLSIGQNAEVLNRSYQQIRAINKEAKIFVLVNNFKTEPSSISIRLMSVIKTLLNKIVGDPNFQLIPTDTVAIRESNLLKHFGENSKLEFLNVAGRCYPRQDFLALADFLLENEHLSTQYATA